MTAASPRPYPVSDAARCIGCGCSNQRACLGGCSWYSITPPVCSVCIMSGKLCADTEDGQHVLFHLTPTTGFCDACRLPFVATEVA
jgi:hypothetical protein